MSEVNLVWVTPNADQMIGYMKSSLNGTLLVSF